MNIVLTGFMGTGKTTVGRRVAEALNAAFLDVDAALEKEAGHSVAHIFEAKGEAHFRALERAAIARLAESNHAVIATGGGALLDPENRGALKKNGYLICLTARAGTLLERLKDDMARPLLAGEDPAGRIERLLKERHGVYALCDLQIQTDDRTIEDVAKAIVQAVEKRWKKD
jgi:shikimate kinase